MDVVFLRNPFTYLDAMHDLGKVDLLFSTTDTAEDCTMIEKRHPLPAQSQNHQRPARDCAGDLQFSLIQEGVAGWGSASRPALTLITVTLQPPFARPARLWPTRSGKNDFMINTGLFFARAGNVSRAMFNEARENLRAGKSYDKGDQGAMQVAVNRVKFARVAALPCALFANGNMCLAGAH